MSVGTSSAVWQIVSASGSGVLRCGLAGGLCPERTAMFGGCGESVG